MRIFRNAASLAALVVLGLILGHCSKGGDERGADASAQDPAGRIYDTVEQMPRQINVVSVEYPRAALSHDLEGVVHVKMLLSAAGTVEQASVSRSSDVLSLDSTAVEAAKGCLFSPALSDGQPVRLWLYKTFAFRLNQIRVVESNGQRRYLIDF